MLRRSRCISEGKNIRRTLHPTRKWQWYKKYSEKGMSPNKEKEKKKGRTRVCAVGARWLQRKHKDENEARQNRHNARKRRHDICKPNAQRTQVRALWLVNKGERTSTSPLALGYPLLGPSRHVRAYDCMPLVQPWLSLQRSI